MLSFDSVQPSAFVVLLFLVLVQSLGFVLWLSVTRSLASGAMLTCGFAPVHGTVSALAAMSPFGVVAAEGMMEAFGVKGPCGAVPTFGVLLPLAVAQSMHVVGLQGFEAPDIVVQSTASDLAAQSIASEVTKSFEVMKSFVLVLAFGMLSL